MNFVLDCSMTMCWCFEDEANEEADQVLIHLKNKKALVPNIWSLEVINVLRVAERKKRITVQQANNFIHLLNNLPIEIDKWFNDKTNQQIFELSRKFGLSSYDAAYLELALRYQIPLFSQDKALCQSAIQANVPLKLSSEVGS